MEGKLRMGGLGLLRFTVKNYAQASKFAICLPKDFNRI